MTSILFLLVGVLIGLTLAFVLGWMVNAGIIKNRDNPGMAKISADHLAELVVERMEQQDLARRAESVISK